MSNKDLFKEAIADAKAVREAALANAKVALEEALAPKLQSMLSAKLQEMDMDDLEAEEENLEEKSLGQDTYRTDDFQHVGARERHAALEEDELEEDFDLSSILAELSDDEEKSEMNEAEEEAEEEEVEVEDEESEDEDESEEEAEDEGENITDLTMDELKDIIKDIISSEMGSDEMDADMDDMGGEDEMAVDLDSEEGDEEVAMEDEIDLEELLAELDAMGDQDDENESMYEAKKKLKKDDKEDKEEMKEAIATIETLRNELNEVNLLNAKLLYVNKVFKAKNLTESQKLKVIAQFDRATTAKEAKAIFESMNNAIAKSAKSQIKESLGFASKAAGVAPQKPIVDETMSRWQTLAGITKF
jgi:hypothetical protein